MLCCVADFADVAGTFAVAVTCFCSFFRFCCCCGCLIEAISVGVSVASAVAVAVATHAGGESNCSPFCGWAVLESKWGSTCFGQSHAGEVEWFFVLFVAVLWLLL